MIDNRILNTKYSCEFRHCHWVRVSEKVDVWHVWSHFAPLLRSTTSRVYQSCKSSDNGLWAMRFSWASHKRHEGRACAGYPVRLCNFRCKPGTVLMDQKMFSKCKFKNVFRWSEGLKNMFSCKVLLGKNIFWSQHWSSSWRISNNFHNFQIRIFHARSSRRFSQNR